MTACLHIKINCLLFGHLKKKKNLEQTKQKQKSSLNYENENTIIHKFHNINNKFQ